MGIFKTPHQGSLPPLGEWPQWHPSAAGLLWSQETRLLVLASRPSSRSMTCVETQESANASRIPAGKTGGDFTSVLDAGFDSFAMPMFGGPYLFKVDAVATINSFTSL